MTIEVDTCDQCGSELEATDNAFASGKCALCQRNQNAVAETQKFPCPRFEFLWEPIDEPSLDAKQEQVFIDNNMPVPRYDWKCTYSLVIPLHEHDMRFEEHGAEMRLAIHVTRAVRYGHSPIERSGKVEAPFRDSHHAKWDRKSLGCGDVPLVAICKDKMTIIDME